MNPLTLEWVEKAEGDYATALRELRARKSPNYDAACFHAQQLAEKYLKAFLQESEQLIPKTHSLIDLLALVLEIDTSFHMIRPDLIRLDRYAVRFRYPGERADREEARFALRSAEAVRQFGRAKLGLTF
jgi:HEPN domain-containing protein